MKLSFIGRLSLGITMTTICVFGIFDFFKDNLNDDFGKYISLQGKKITTKIVTDAVGETIDKFGEEEMIVGFNEEKTDIDYNVKNINLLLNTISNNIINKVNLLSDGVLDISSSFQRKSLDQGLIYEVPLSLAFNNGLLARFGPKIPVRFSVLSDVTLDCTTEVKEFGLNNALVRININVNMISSVIIPLSSDNVEINVAVPLSIKVIQGKVPSIMLGEKSIAGVDKIIEETGVKL